MPTRYQERSKEGSGSVAVDRAVSPVIGVVLMVVLAVSLAAVVGGLTTGMVEDASLETAPGATISVANDGDGDGIRVAHDGGEALSFAEVTVVVREVDGPEIPQDDLTFEENGSELHPGGTFVVDSNEFVDGTEYEIVLVDGPSGNVIDRAVIEYQD